MLTDKNKIEFCDCFIKRYLGDNSFGAMPNSEIDILVFHLLSELSELKSKTNYEIANSLKITESRVKSLRLYAALRYSQVDHKEVLKQIVNRIIEKIQTTEFENGRVSTTLENPVEKRKFEHAIKKVGGSIEYGINREILKILESTEFYPEFGKATSRKPSTLSKSILSRRNFLKIES